MSFTTYLEGLVVMLVMATATWLLSLARRDVSIVDSLWSLMILAGGIVYFAGSQAHTARDMLVLGLLLVWALRLSAYLTWRNWGEPEDRRYRQMREDHSPGFPLKSLGLIFWLQAVIAWVVSLPLWPALGTGTTFQLLDGVAVTLWLVGMVFEVVGDWQLARFKANPDSDGKVLDTGLWRYTRHPNYFGEALIWWGFYLFAVGAGAWWTLPAPLLMNWLLLKFSGVVMLEKSVVDRRPAYREYIETTNAFIPGPRKAS